MHRQRLPGMVAFKKSAVLFKGELKLLQINCSVVL